MAVKTFITGEKLTAADTNTYLNNGGLVYISSTTIGSAVSSVNVTSCFSATYDAYRIVMNNVTLGGSGYTTLMQARMLSGTTANTGSSYTYGFIKVDQGTGAVSGDYSSGTTVVLISRGTNGVFGTSFDVLNPFAAQYTLFTNMTYTNGFNGYGGAGGGCHAVATSYDGIQFLPSTSTMTGGTITVYGYRKA